MTKKIFFPIVLVLLGLTLFISPNFEQISAGVAILLFGMIMLEEGFNAFVKGPLQKLLKKATNKLYKSSGLRFFGHRNFTIQFLNFCYYHFIYQCWVYRSKGRYRHHLWCKYWHHCYCLVDFNFWVTHKSFNIGHAHVGFWNPLCISKI